MSKVRSLIYGALLLLALPPFAQAADECKRVEIDAKVTVNGEVYDNVTVKVGAHWDLLEAAMGVDPDGAVTLTTDKDGRLRGHFDDCDGVYPQLLFRLRTDFFEDTAELPLPSDFKFTKAIDFKGPGVKRFYPVPPKTKIEFRFPVRDPKLIIHHAHLEMEPAFLVPEAALAAHFGTG